jgi:hypothetical protein
MDFKFYDLVWWLDQPTKLNFTDHTRRLAQWLGVLRRVGSDLSYWLITDSSKIISKTSVEHVTHDNYLQTEKKAEIDEFNKKIDESLANANFAIKGEGEFDSMYLDDIDDDMNPGVTCENNRNMPSESLDYRDMLTNERPDDEDEEAVDKYLNVEIIMNMGTNDERRGRVIKRTRGLDGDPISRAHASPLFDTREYEIEFTDGTNEKYQVNIIAENMFAQLDSKGNQNLLLQEIMDHKKDNSAIPISDSKISSANGQSKPKTMARWVHKLGKAEGLEDIEPGRGC